MRTKIIIFLLIVLPAITYAEDMHEHGSKIFHAVRLDTDIGANRDGTLSKWDLDGWIGSDYNKLWLKSEGEVLNGDKTERSEYWAMYSRNIATFWDGQIGVRHDDTPTSVTYLTAGLTGLAPYFFETQAHLFVSDKGDVSARLREENDFLITQKLIIKPYTEINLYAQDVPEQKIGAGISNAEFGLQTRYEITRKLAPYIDFRYDNKFGETANIAKKNGEHVDDLITSIGIRLLF